ncbi:MAG: hypothetical protein WA089_12930 [Anaerolineae bacterium]|uniref:hypothetical protein n=1 Tax=Candidatus Amarolinea dominans TaxID=3140696 RepID=UPI0031349C2D|nr:hypothetical protein [Anaerolineae bacterium]
MSQSHSLAPQSTSPQQPPPSIRSQDVWLSLPHCRQKQAVLILAQILVKVKQMEASHDQPD